MKVDFHPTVCNLCGGEVIFASNASVYGKEYGSGKCYICIRCKAYVGTHVPRPTEALGILANKEMREMKRACHEVFDKGWKTEPQISRQKKRSHLYGKLAEELGIPRELCHFRYFDMPMLKKAYNILTKGK